MTEVMHPETEELIRKAVDRATAPYVGRAPPVVLAKLRELSERYWRENPTAIRAVQLMRKQRQVRSGTGRIDGEDEAGQDVARKGRG